LHESNRIERKGNKMSSKTAVANLHHAFAAIFEKDPCNEASMASQLVAPRSFPGARRTGVKALANDPCEENKIIRRFSLLEFLFPDRGLETFRQVEGGQEPSVLMYTRMGDNIVASRWSPPSGRSER
jgi:hypothetical protein